LVIIVGLGNIIIHTPYAMSYTFGCSLIVIFLNCKEKTRKIVDKRSPTYRTHLQTKITLSHNFRSKPCPFGLGLRKFALDPVVVIFFKKWQKNYKWWSDLTLRKFALDFDFRKIYKYEIKPPLVIFLLLIYIVSTGFT
jgi:hypothetical protein